MDPSGGAKMNLAIAVSTTPSLFFDGTNINKASYNI